ncbi:MAG TPA: DUF4351 domain-containing protein [Rhodocyclaceae bacterium]|nr:DUF4351 domain-containing protein [Rhodocyclaceae bacterium]
MSDSVSTTIDDYDSPWKEALERYFPEFMAFYFPAAHASIDWRNGYLSRETELRQVVRDAELGKRFADALVQVTLDTGTPEWIYVHVEVQGQRQTQFAQRMFVYNYRLYDRFECPIASLAVLADDDEYWKPDHFAFDVLGCRHSLHFPVVKLTDYASKLESLPSEANPFALVTAAHLLTRQTRQDANARYEAKRALVRLLYRRDWDKQRILDLFAILDWMMRLPDALEQKLWQDIETIEGENRMRYVTSVERLAAERGLKVGMQQGMQQGRLEGEVALLERQLIKRFGPLTAEIRQRLVDADTERLEYWAERVLDAPTLNAVFEQH